ncbi:hypothetical protein [Microcoleus sp. T3_A4]
MTQLESDHQPDDTKYKAAETRLTIAHSPAPLSFLVCDSWADDGEET